MTSDLRSPTPKRDIPTRDGETALPGVTADQLRPGDNARTRLRALLDEDSFVELGAERLHNVDRFGMASKRPPGDGVVAGTGLVGGRAVAVYAQDGKVLGGSLGEAHADKIARTLRTALRGGVPVVGINDSGGARIQEGVAALDGYGGVFSGNVSASGRVPQVAVLAGPCAGGAVYSPALMDLVVMTDDASMFLTGPRVVKAVTGEDTTARALGGPEVHSQTSGVAHLVAKDVEGALHMVRDVLSYLPSSCDELPPVLEARSPDPADLSEIVPREGRAPYDVRDAMRCLVDGGEFRELQPDFARNVVTAYARVDGHTVGVIANQANWLAGVLDIQASEKGARFVRGCDAFGIPLVVLTDVPGFLPGTDQENGGVIRKGAKLLHAFTNATVPRVTVVMRKAFGGAYIVMNSRSIGADAVLAWPGAELAVMGAEGAVDIIHRRTLKDAPDRRSELVEAYKHDAMRGELAAHRGSVDQIVAPGETRDAIIGLLRTLRPARAAGYKHDNLPQ